MKTKYPFKFLDAYGADDGKIFFGRDKEVEELYQMVFQTDLLLLYGSSGTGKTSLVKCGLSNKFQEHDWYDVYITRQKYYPKAVKDALQNEVKKFSDEAELEESWMYGNYESKAASYATKLTEIQKACKRMYLNTFKPIFLIFDQFEELFILGDEKEQEAFFEIVEEILTYEYPVKIIIIIREEFIGYLYKYERKIPKLFDKKMRIEPMTRSNLFQVVTGVAECNESIVQIEDGREEEITDILFEKLQNKAHRSTIDLPYLQVFLDNLYLSITKDDSRKSEATITVDALNAVGDIDDILKEFLENQVVEIATANELKQRTVWKILSPFTTLEGTKEPMARESLLNKISKIPEEKVVEVIESCVNSRILRYNEQSDLYEVAHDSLALRISEKRSEKDIHALQLRKLIQNQVSVPEGERSYFSQKQYLSIEPYIPYNGLELTPEELDWVFKSGKQIEKEQKKKKNRLAFRIATLAAVLIASLIALNLYQANRWANDRLAQSFEIEQNALKYAGQTAAENKALDSILRISNANERLRSIFASADLQTDYVNQFMIGGMTFKTVAEHYPYSTTGEPMLRFKILPASNTYHFADWNLVFFKFMDGEARNKVMLAGQENAFSVDYDGYGCFKKVMALIEFKDVWKKSAVVEFNMCENMEVIGGPREPIQGK